MKRKMICSLLVSVIVLTGCAREYSAEKDFYKASKLFDKAKNDEITTRWDGNLAALYAPALRAFEKVVEKYPTSPKTAESLFRITWIQVKLKNYEQARAALQKIVTDFSQFGTNGSDARFETGRLYELEGRWKEAEAMYWDTAEYHALQKKGLYAPIYIFLHYKNDRSGKTDVDKKEEIYIKARQYYKSLLDKVGPIQMSAGIRNYLALLYLAHREWRKARQEWLAIATDFPTGPYGALSMMAAADVSAQRKGESETAIGLYRRFVKQYPNHPFAAKATVQTGVLYMQRKDYAKARLWFQKALNRYASKDETWQAGLKLLIGKSYQDEGLWDTAEKIYHEAEREHPSTVGALQVPLLVWTHYNSKGEKEKSRGLLEQAIARYDQVAKEHPRTKLARLAKRYQNFLYGQNGDWKQVLANIDYDVAREKRADLKGNWLFEKAVITEKRLQDKAKAIDFYQDFLTHYPNHRLANVARVHLAVLTQK